MPAAERRAFEKLDVAQREPVRLETSDPTDHGERASGVVGAVPDVAPRLRVVRVLEETDVIRERVQVTEEPGGAARYGHAAGTASRAASTSWYAAATTGHATERATSRAHARISAAIAGSSNMRANESAI